MKNLRYLYILLLTIAVSVTIFGCHSSNSSHQWFRTIDDAIAFGMEQEESEMLIELDYDRHRFILFHSNDDPGIIGVGNVVVDPEQGYRWNKGAASFDHHMAMFEYTLANGKVFNIVAGRVSDSSINQVRLQSLRANYTVDVHKGHFIKIDIPSENYQVIPIK